MQRPDPIFVYRSGVKNTLDFALLWHLALCGLTGSTISGMVDALGVSDGTVRTGLYRLESAKLVVGANNRDKPGHPLMFVCSRLGYRLMTGHLASKEKTTAAGQMPLGSEIVHQS